MYGEGKTLGCLLEEGPDGLSSLAFAPDATVPNGVFREKLGQGVGVIIIVAV